MVLLAGYVFAGEARGSRLRRPMGEEKTVGAWYQRHGEAARHLLMVALFSTVVVGGFEGSPDLGDGPISSACTPRNSSTGFSEAHGAGCSAHSALHMRLPA